MERRGWVILLSLVLSYLAAPAGRVWAADQPIDARDLRIIRSASGREKMVFVSRDPGFLFPAIGGVDDPASGTPGGVLIELFSANDPVLGLFTAPPGIGKPGWKVKNGTVGRYKFHNKDAPSGVSSVRTLVVAEGKVLKVVAQSAGLALTGPQASIGVRITMGSQRSCALFAGATVTRDQAGSFRARRALASTLADCSDDSLRERTLPVAAEMFGIDFWSADPDLWQAFLDLLDEDGVPFGLVGFDVGWERVEPAPPAGGAHSYDWSSTDELLGIVAASGRVMDLEVLSRNDWGTVVPFSALDEACCDMSPPKEDPDCDTAAYGMTCWQAWSDFVFNLVERYDGDGIDDAPGITKRVIKYLQLGNEPDAVGHFVDNGGSPELLERMLEAMNQAAKAADPEILVVRGKSNPAHVFDDDPDASVAAARRPAYLDFISTNLSTGEGDFDLFAINFNDHYTGLPAFSAWLQAEMAAAGYTRPLMVGDARMTLYPRDNDDTTHILPPRYPGGFIDTLRTPSAPDYAANKSLYQADEVRQSLRKIIVAVGSGQQAVSLQPAFQGPIHNRNLWQDAGFVDPRVWLAAGDLRTSREPVYFAVWQLLDLLVPAQSELQSLDLGPNVFTFRVGAPGSTSFLLWHEDPFDVDAQGLVRRDQARTVDLSPFVATAQVRLVHFVTELAPDGSALYPADVLVPTATVAIDETPVLAIAE